MNKSITKLILPALAVMPLLTFEAAYSQYQTGIPGNPPAADSLTLEQVISTVVQGHPSVKVAEEALNNAEALIGLARSGYLPNVDASASYSRVGPVPSFVFEINGKPMNIKLFPEDNYSAGLNYNQSIYDFGKTSRNVAYETENKKLAGQSIEQVKQRLSLVAANTYFSLVYLQEALAIKDEQLKTLEEHLEFIQKKKETGSATQYEILTTKVKISGVESQKIDLETARKIQISILNSLMGQPENSIHYARKDYAVILPMVRVDSLLSYADQNRDEMKIAKERQSLAELRYKVVKAQVNPVISLFASGGGKNGYVPELDIFKANFVAGLGLRVPIFDGNRTRNNLLQVKSSIQSASLETEIAHRNITNEVIESEANLTSSQKKVDQFQLQLTQAEQAFALAKVSYQAGVITNLDLLDAATSVSESSLLLLKAKIDHTVSIYLLKMALGERLY